MSEALHEGANNESVFCTILTGVGKMYSSGTDLFESSNISTENLLNAVR